MTKPQNAQFKNEDLFDKVVGAMLHAFFMVAYWIVELANPPLKEFTSSLGTLKIPETWTDKPHRLAFNGVGRYVTKALQSNAMRQFEDSNLLDVKDFGYVEGVSLEVWHEALKLFEDAGWIERRWRLELPDPSSNGRRGLTPHHDEQGTRLPAPPHHPLQGEVVKEGVRNLYLLSNEERQALLGVSYPLYSKDYVRTEERSYLPQQVHVIIDETSFIPVYYRPWKILDKESIDEAKDVIKILHRKKAFKGQ